MQSPVIEETEWPTAVGCGTFDAAAVTYALQTAENEGWKIEMNDTKNIGRPDTTQEPSGAVVNVASRKSVAANKSVAFGEVAGTVDALVKMEQTPADRRLLVAAMTNQIEVLQKDNLRLESALAELSRKEAASNYLAYHDGLTALPNRRLLMDRFQQAAASADRHSRQVALLFVDLDRFKRINDRFGHWAGDMVLQVVAERIRLTIRVTDTACRYGGDEFVIMLPDLVNTATIDDLAQTIQTRLAYSYDIDGVAITLQSSLGIAIYPQDGNTWDSLLRQADAAMYRSKAQAAPNR